MATVESATTRRPIIRAFMICIPFANLRPAAYERQVAPSVRGRAPGERGTLCIRLGSEGECAASTYPVVSGACHDVGAAPIVLSPLCTSTALYHNSNVAVCHYSTKRCY